MRTEILDRWPQVAALAPEWNTLLARSRADSVFLTSEWIQAWIDVTGHAHEPLVVAVRDDQGALCGLAPFYVVRYRLARLLPYRMLQAMGDAPTSGEYPDWILRDDCEAAAADQIAAALAAERRRWDCLWLPRLSGWTGALERIAGACGRAGLVHISRPRPFSCAELPDSIEAFQRSLAHRRQTGKQLQEILSRPGVSVTRCASAAEIPDYLEALFRLHGLRRGALGDEGSFAREPQKARFYQRFAPAALAAGWLRLYALREAGAFRAVQIGYAYKGVFNGVQDGLDPDFAAGVGNVLRFEVIRACIAEGLRQYDFLGGFTEHKRRWRAQLRQGCDLFAARPGLATKPLVAAGIWPGGRYLKPLSAPEPRAVLAQACATES